MIQTYGLENLKTKLTQMTQNLSQEEKLAIRKQNEIVSSPLTYETERNSALKTIHDTFSAVAKRTNLNYENPETSYGQIVNFENSTFTTKSSNLFGLSIRQSYDQPKESIKTVSLLAHPTQELILIFAKDTREDRDVILMEYVKNILPINCNNMPSALDENLYNTMIQRLSL